MIHRSSDVPLYLKVLVYGHSGVGKTVFACSGQGHQALTETLVMNIEGGQLSVRRDDVLLTDQVKSLAQVNEVFSGLSSGKGEYEGVKTLVIDSGSELVMCMLHEIVRKRTKSEEKIDDVELQDYGKNTKLCSRIFRKFRDLNMNVICTALTRERGPAPTTARPEPEPTYCGPGFPKELAKNIRGYFDHVWALDSRESGERVLLHQSKGIWVAKTRNPAFAEYLGEYTINPNLGKIYDTLVETQESK